MPHETGLIATIAAGIGLAFVLGLLAVRLRLPPIVGYLLAGVAVGPHSPGFVADMALAQQLAEIGVILLMFGVGIHFSLDDLLSVRRIALPGAAVQIAAATLLGALLARLWGWSWGSGIVFGLCLSVASTVVLLRALEDRGLFDSADGRIAVGWLVVEDLFTVLVLVLLPALSLSLGGKPPAAHGSGADMGLAGTVAITLGKVSAFVVLMLVVGRRAVPWLLERVARLGSRELFTLSVLAVAVGTAVGAAYLFGISFALGAFFAGMVVNSSDLSHEAAADALPFQDAFSVLFFVAVGMLFDPAILVRQPLDVVAVILIIMIGKSLGALGIVLLFGYSLHTALVISASLAQVGEFSFILAALGLSLGLLPAEGQSLIVAAALLTISLNPLAFEAATRLGRWAAGRPRLLAALERGTPEEPVAARDDHALREHAILVGYGRVGSTIGEALAGAKVPYVVIEQSRELFESLRDRGVPAIYGNASRPTVLELAHPERARLIIVTAPDPFQARAVVDQARRTNRSIATVVRTHSEEERVYLERAGVDMVVMGERELARTMARSALEVADRPALSPVIG
ncbi:MAG TPA: YbaL family putative K(+) efflux transporter [Gemmatimonadales bacterium]|jgi:CPA2 family monovalent cation:H+ antiporter-2